MIKVPGFEKIKNQEDQRDDAVVDAIPKERVGGSSQEFEIAAEQDKGGDVPAHNKHSNRDANNSKTDSRRVPKIFGGKVKGVGPKTFHEQAINRAKKHKPEYEQNLVSPEMQE